MTPASWILASTLAFTTVLGIAIFIAKPTRTTNQAFFILSSAISGWLFSVLSVFSSATVEVAAMWIRSASVVGAFLPVAITILRLAIVHPSLTFSGLLKRIPGWLGLYVIVVSYCLTPAYLVGATLRPGGVPDAVYGSWSWLFPSYFIGALIWVFGRIVGEWKAAAGIHRVELSYVFVGLCCFLGVGFFVAVFPLLTGNSQSVPFAPLWIALMDAAIAYGIATQRILSVGSVMRRVVAYSILGGYLILIYEVVTIGAQMILSALGISSSTLPSQGGALAMVIGMARAKGVMQWLIGRLFINLKQVNLRAALKEADASLGQVTTTDELLRHSIELLRKATGAELVGIRLHTLSGEVTDRSTLAKTPEKALKRLAEALQRETRLVYGPTTHRSRSQGLAEVADALEELKAVIVIPLGTSVDFNGFIFLGERLSGQVYDAEDQEALQLLANRLATALDNSRLYTELRNHQRYLESLVDELSIGVLAVDQDGRISVCNCEAATILGRSAADLIGTGVGNLPALLAESLATTLRIGIPHSEEFVLETSHQAGIPVRFSTKRFSGTTESAFLILSDLTDQKKLQEQLRRADRLSSLGTMAASIAHEIKNPLVPLKTYADLLPERLDDQVFLHKVSSTVREQVGRIEGLVSQMLSFGKAIPSHRRRVHLHEVIDSTAGLLAHEFTVRGISLSVELAASSDGVEADVVQIEQVLLNVFLNAVEAMTGGGSLSVRTYHPIMRGQSDQIVVEIADTGSGVPKELMSTIFSPFVSGKANGTGLGLSIAQGIMIDHGGTITIENHAGGAVVRIEFPLANSTRIAA